MKDRPTVLVVDDVPTSARLLSRRLQKEGYRLLESEDGMRGYRLALEEQPDLILLDVMMPGKDGFEVCSMLKSDERTQGIPVIFLTAKTDTVDRIRGLELGAVGYITKPFDPAEMLVRVRSVLELKELRDRLEEANRRLVLAYAQMRDSKDRMSALRYREEIGFLIAEDGRIWGITERALESTGWTRIELLGSNIVDLVEDGSRHELRHAMKQALIGTSSRASVRMIGSKVFDARVMRVSLEQERMLWVVMWESDVEADERVQTFSVPNWL